MNIDRKFPSVAEMQAAAKRRVPSFAYEYLSGGIGQETALKNNREALDQVKLTPRYLSSVADRPDCSHQLFGRTYDAPFGVAPIGLGGLMWPRLAEHLAAAASSHNIPFALSGFGTTGLESIAEIALPNAWFQHYVTVDESINRSLVEKARTAGYEVLVITVDIPTVTRRAKDIRNGLSVPPRFDLRTIWDIALRPRWAIETLQAGIPRFQNLLPYIPEGSNLEQLGVFLSDVTEGHVSVDKLKWFRELWPGKLLVKGILDPREAELCKSIGIDAIIVSNHGGRQLDATRSPIEVIGSVRDAVGADMPLLADGGVRSGLDVLRFLARGADFVLVGRAFVYAVCAIGAAGADHVMNVFKEEFRMSMAQTGCPTVTDISSFAE